MSTQLISPLHAQRLDIRCSVVDVALSNVAIHFVFFFQRQLDTTVLADVEKLPIPYQGSGVISRRSFMKSSPATATPTLILSKASGGFHDKASSPK